MSDSPQAFKALRDAQRNARQIMIEGVLWLVYELPPLPFDRRSTASLVFETETTVRRVRDYPTNWRTLSDDELVALSWSV